MMAGLGNIAASAPTSRRSRRRQLRCGRRSAWARLHPTAQEARSDRVGPHARPTRRRAPWPSHPLRSLSRDHSPADRRSPPAAPRPPEAAFASSLLGRGGFERGGEKLFAGNQRGNEERPGQETERAGSLVRTLRSGFENLPLLFDQFALFYFVHDRRLFSFPRSTHKQLSPGSIHCQASFFGASGVRVVRRVRRHVEMPYVEVIRRAHLADGVFERIVGRHRSERALHVTE